jgi:hypothetical protein
MARPGWGSLSIFSENFPATSPKPLSPSALRANMIETLLVT